MDKNRQDVLLHCSIPECTSKIKSAPYRPMPNAQLE
jgi:hypothetical protein